MKHLHRKCATRNGITRGITIESRKLRSRQSSIARTVMGALALSAFMVADVTMSLKSLLRVRTGTNDEPKVIQPGNNKAYSYEANP
jgi:hypothetical protein